jgi:hypothetical protein
LFDPQHNQNGIIGIGTQKNMMKFVEIEDYNNRGIGSG